MHEFLFGSDSECMSFYVRQIQCLLPKSVFDVLHEWMNDPLFLEILQQFFRM